MSKGKYQKDLARRQELQVSTSFSASASFSGPLPHPALLDQFERIVPGAAERIIRMAEEQAAHRRGLEKTAVEANAWSQKAGPVFGFIVAMTAILGGFVLVFYGHSTYGIAAIITALASLAAVFVVGRWKQGQERADKADAFVRAVAAGSQ